jgi:hypothetical protein
MSSVSIDRKDACPASESSTSGEAGGRSTASRGGPSSSPSKHRNTFLYLHETHPFHPPYSTWRGGGAAPEILPSGTGS